MTSMSTDQIDAVLQALRACDNGDMLQLSDHVPRDRKMLEKYYERLNKGIK